MRGTINQETSEQFTVTLFQQTLLFRLQRTFFKCQGWVSKETQSLSKGEFTIEGWKLLYLYMRIQNSLYNNSVHINKWSQISIEWATLYIQFASD